MQPSSRDNLCDAHHHFSEDQSFEGRSVVNGTSPDDWERILENSTQDSKRIPAIGLHPWRVGEAPRNWQDRFLEALDQGARAIGEIGLDRQFAEDTFEAQCDAFVWQLQQAAKANFPVSIHCLKATASLLEILRENELPERGVHLHAYSGSAEEAGQFTELGAYFSFHHSQLKPPARKAPEALGVIPLDRLLIETDAPSTLSDGETQGDYLEAAYERIASLRGIERSDLNEQVTANFQRYFLNV